MSSQTYQRDLHGLWRTRISSLKDIVEEVNVLNLHILVMICEQGIGIGIGHICYSK